MFEEERRCSSSEVASASATLQHEPRQQHQQQEHEAARQTRHEQHSGVASRVTTHEHGSVYRQVSKDERLVVRFLAVNPSFFDRETGSTQEPVIHFVTRGIPGWQLTLSSAALVQSSDLRR